jgi:tRNA threonylcarbamoyladenosine biosynthesis protein TsaE
MLQIYPLLLQKCCCKKCYYCNTDASTHQILQFAKASLNEEMNGTCLENEEFKRTCRLMEFHIRDIDKAAQWVLEQSAGHLVIALYAPMGAGKTTLSSAILQALGSSDHAASPTFSIINEYLLPDGTTLYHMDWYRLKGEEEAIAAGVEDAMYSGHRCLVEWPEKAADLLPDDTARFSIEITGPETRSIKVIGVQ